VAGHLIVTSHERGLTPRAIRSRPAELAAFQRRLDRAGVERAWPVVEGY